MTFDVSGVRVSTQFTDNKWGNNKMETVRKIVRMILQYIGGLIFAYGVGIWCIGGIGYIVFSMLGLQADSKTYLTLHVFFFLGIPLGGYSGILLVDKLIYKSSRLFIWRMLSGFLMGVLGSVVVYWVPFLQINLRECFSIPISEDTYLSLTSGGIESFFLISTLFALIGYNALR